MTSIGQSPTNTSALHLTQKPSTLLTHRQRIVCWSVCFDPLYLIPVTLADTLYHFAMLNSTMHNVWMRAVCGRLKSDYRYSNTIVYNNYPWPDAPTDKQREAIETTGQSVLDARALYPDATLADLYDPLTMPTQLRKAHQSVDKAVDAAYDYKGGKDDAARVAYLFGLYEQYTSFLPTHASKPKRRKAVA